MSSIAPDFDRALDRYQRGDLEEAKTLCQQLLQQNPHRLDGLNLLGGIAYQQQRWHDALRCYKTIVRLYPGCGVGHANLGRTLQELDRLEEAVPHYQRALAIAPQNPEWHYNLGHLYWDLGRLEEAIAQFETTMQLEVNFPDIRGHLALVLLLQGQWKRGFAEYEGRPVRDRLSQTFPHPERIWDGSEIAGKRLLLLCEQGFGDAIQFVRYVPMLAQRGAQVWVRCRPPLVRLLQTVPGCDRVLSTEDPLPHWDAHALLMSLPFLLETHQNTVASAVPYLNPPTSALSPSPPLPLSPSPFPKVGLVWSGRATHRKDKERSIAFDRLQQLLEIPEIEFYSVQKDPRPEDAKILATEWRLRDLVSNCRDFADTAAAIAFLDLVVTVDTSVAHLAGAMGKPVWLLLANVPDWRWGLTGETTPWYPTMRLFRQRRRGEWETVLADLDRALRQWRSSWGRSSQNAETRYPIIF
ncbi:tetratricopeptide repeat-containing glycosyltransferase family protein [Baaleninema simplex]|uniref:tetratricopeptide repeat-containing glycosyltransferase family protein n=1 Tax=Baaleninema simplex TaxID=2862350 RepID=UPI000363EB5B|nr:tetratricopeptide repeat-containing glycosyltransferase family protein [Baaleninema simplex]